MRNTTRKNLNRSRRKQRRRRLIENDTGICAELKCEILNNLWKPKFENGEVRFVVIRPGDDRDDEYCGQSIYDVGLFFWISMDLKTVRFEDSAKFSVMHAYDLSNMIHKSLRQKFNIRDPNERRAWWQSDFDDLDDGI